jgi:hypothetical protein
MKKILSLTAMLLLVLYSGALAQNGTANIRFSWEHEVPDDMGEYTLYELTESGGAPTGTTFVVPYIDGTVPPFISDQTLTVPCDAAITKCYHITAKDVADPPNESDPSNEACADILVDCIPAAPANFTVEFPVAGTP